MLKKHPPLCFTTPPPSTTQLLFISGVATTIGPQKALKFFIKPKNIKVGAYVCMQRCMETQTIHPPPNHTTPSTYTGHSILPWWHGLGGDWVDHGGHGSGNLWVLGIVFGVHSHDFGFSAQGSNTGAHIGLANTQNCHKPHCTRWWIASVGCWEQVVLACIICDYHFLRFCATFVMMLVKKKVNNWLLLLLSRNMSIAGLAES